MQWLLIDLDCSVDMIATENKRAMTAKQYAGIAAMHWIDRCLADAGQQSPFLPAAAASAAGADRLGGDKSGESCRCLLGGDESGESCRCRLGGERSGESWRWRLGGDISGESCRCRLGGGRSGESCRCLLGGDISGESCRCRLGGDKSADSSSCPGSESASWSATDQPDVASPSRS